MNIQKIYNELIDITELLYCNDDNGLILLANMAEKFNEFIEIVVMKEIEKITVLQDIFAKFNDAVKNQDKLQLADIIYYDICTLLLKYGEKCYITIRTEKKHMKLETAIKTYESSEIFKENIKKISELNYNMYDSLVEFCNEFDVNEKEIAADGYGNIAILKNGRWWGINSFYNREHAVDRGTQLLKNKGYISMLFILGMGNADYIKKIIEIVPSDTSIYIYEPDQRIFAMNMYYNDLHKIFERKNTFLFVEGLNEKKMDALVYYFSDNITARYVYTFISPGYDVIYGDELQEKVKTLNTVMDHSVVVDNTIDRFGEAINYNRIMNMPMIFDSILISDVKKQFQNHLDYDNIPAIIIAAGPSLDKNIEKLHEVRGKAFIVAVDSSIRMCVQHNIIPDAFVTIDPCKQKILFENQLVEKLPFFYGMHSTYDNIKKLKGKKIFCHIDNIIPKEIAGRMEVIEAGGSVANTAFSIVEYLGFKNIITIGLDLAFLDKKKHASIVYEDGGINEKEAKYYTYVKGQNGEMLQTYENFMIYKEQFEKKIENNSELTFINATEGGALIEGAVNMTLSEAIKKYCNKEINIQKLISECPESFNTEEKGNRKKFLQEYIKECDEVKEYYKECCEWYKEILQCKDFNRIKELMKLIDSNNIKANKKFVSEIINDYSSWEADQQLDLMYMESSNNDISLEEEIKHIAEKGIKVSQTFKRNAQKTKEMFIKSIDSLRGDQYESYK